MIENAHGSVRDCITCQSKVPGSLRYMERAVRRICFMRGMEEGEEAWRWTIIVRTIVEFGDGI